MNITTIAEAGQLPHKTVIDKMVVTVKSAFNPEQKESQYGPYTVQNATVEDDTGTIKCAFFDANINLKNFIGQQIAMSSQDGKGLTRNDYNNRKTGSVEPQLKASKQTIIDEVTGGGGASQASGNSVTGGGDVQSPSPRVVPAGVPKVNYAPDEDKRQASFERQKALEMAVAFVKPLGGPVLVEADTVVKTAEVFYTFLSGHKPQAEVFHGPLPIPTFPDLNKAGDESGLPMPEFQDPDEDVL